MSDFGFLILGREQVDIRMLHNIVSVSQLNAAAFLLRRMFEKGAFEPSAAGSPCPQKEA